MKKLSVLLVLMLFASPVFAWENNTGWNQGDVRVEQNSVEFAEKSGDPSAPAENRIKMFSKDDSGTTKLYTMTSDLSVNEFVFADSSGDVLVNGSLSVSDGLTVNGGIYVADGAGNGTIESPTGIVEIKGDTYIEDDLIVNDDLTCNGVIDTEEGILLTSNYRTYKARLSQTRLVGEEYINIGNGNEGNILVGGDGGTTKVFSLYNNFNIGWMRDNTTVDNFNIVGVNSVGEAVYLSCTGHPGTSNTLVSVNPSQVDADFSVLPDIGSDPILFCQGSTTGAVGIGTSTPSTKLQIQWASNVDSGFFRGTTDTDITGTYSRSPNGTLWYSWVDDSGVTQTSTSKP